MSKSQKRQQDAKRLKDFMNMRRNQVKEIKAGGTVTDKLNSLILSQSSQQLLKQFRQQKFDFVFNYLISQNEYLKTPITIMFEQPKWKELLSILNDWSSDHQINIFLTEKMDYFCQTPEHLRVMKNRFEEIVRCICAVKINDYQDIVQLFSLRDTFFALIMNFFLSYQNLVGLIPESLHLDLFERVFSKISLNLQLESSKDLCKFAMLKKREKVWSQNSFISAINYPQILILKELNFNFVHQIINKNNEKLFHEVLDYFIEQQNTDTHRTDSQVKQNYFSYFDGSGDIPLDIMLSKWSFSSIQKVLQKIKLLQFIRFSVNSLNKIISNKLLNQKQVESLIEQTLNGQVADKGYCEMVFKQKTIKTKPYTGLIKVPTKQYVVVLDKRKLLMAKDRQSYPLLNYLNRFQTTSSLKIISALFFQGIDRKIVKPKVITLLKKVGTKCTELNSHNQALKQVDDVIYYHQSLLEFICRLPHNDVLEFFIEKLFINYFTISIWSKTDGKPVLHAVNKHFLTYYINAHENLKQNNLNKKILDKIFEAKENEKIVSDFNMYVELLRQLTQYKAVYNKDEWLVLKIKEKLKEYVKGLQNHIFIEIFSYINEGEEQQKIFLIDLLNPILSQQQINQLNLPWLPKNEQQNKKGKKKKINYVNGSPHQKIKMYAHNKNIQNFSEELKEKNKEFTENMQKWSQQQKIKKQKQEAFKDNYQYDEQKIMMPELHWSLELDEPDLEKKLHDLINQGCKIDFKLNKMLPNTNPISISKQQKAPKQKRLSRSIVQKYIENIREPYRKIIKCAVFNKCYKSKNKDKSLEFHIALLFCLDEDVPQIMKFLKESPPKFQSILCDWDNSSFSAFRQIEVNPLLLRQIIRDKKMRQVYKIDEKQIRQRIVSNIALGIIKIKCDIKSQKIPQNHIKKMLAYKEIIQELKQTLSSMGLIYQYLQLHSSKVDLSSFYKQLTVKEIFQKKSVKIFVNKLSLSQDPIKQLLQVSSLIEQALSKLEIQSKKVFPKPAVKYQIDNQPGEQEQEFNSLKYKAQSALNFKVLAPSNYQAKRQTQKCFDTYVRILDSLSMQNFELYLKKYQVCTFSKCKFLITRLKDEKKCIKVFDNLIKANNEISSQSQILKQKETQQVHALYDYLHPSNLKFSSSIPSFIRPKFDTFNAILCAFLKADEVVAIRSSNPPSGKITSEKSYFIQKLNFQAYKIYIQYIGKMLLVGNENYTSLQKQAIIYNIFTTLVNTENWMKAVKLVEKIIQLRVLLKSTVNKKQEQTKKEQETQKQEQKEQINLVELFIRHALSLCSKNRQRVSTYKNVEEYQNLIKILFKLLLQQKINTKQDIFQSAWMVSPEQTVKAMKLETITLLTLAKCLNAYPSKVKLIQYISLDEEHLPQKYRPKIEGNYLPFCSYSAQDIEKQPDLIDLMIFEQKIRQKWKFLKSDIKNYCHAFDNKKKTVFLHKLVMKRYKQVYSKEEILSFSSQIFNSGLESLKEIPKQYIDSYFIKNSEIRGISSFKQNLIKELIDMGYIKKQNLLDIIKSSRMNIVDYLFTKLHLKFDYSNIQQMQKQSRTKSSFITTLLNLENQIFPIQFIKKFNVFHLYPETKFEDMTKDLLWGIALLHRTQLLKQFLNYLSGKLKSTQLKFKQAPVSQEYSKQQGFVPKEMQNSGVRDGVTYLPMRIASSNNYYEYYFLLRQSGACQIKFHSSNRFFMNCNPGDYDFIPEMKKRLQMLKLFSQYYSGSKNKMQLYKNVLAPCTLDLKQVEYKGNAKFAMDDLSQFIRCITKQQIFIKKEKQINKYDYKTKKYENRFFAILLMKTIPDTQVSDDDLAKFYVEETPLVAYILKNFKLKVHGHENIEEVIQFHEYLRKLLYTLNPKYLKQCKQPLVEWAFQYSNPFASQIRYFEQPENAEFRKKFIYECFFRPQTIQSEDLTRVDKFKPFEYYYNDKKMIDILIACLVSKFEGNQSALRQFCEESKKSEEQLLLDLSLHVCTLKAMGAQNPIEEGNFIHNPKVWNKIYEELKNIEKVKKFTRKTEFKPFFNQKHANLVNYDANKQIFKKSCSGTLDIYACLSYLNNLLYLIGYEKQLQKQMGDISTEYRDKNYRLSLVLTEEKEKQYNIIDKQEENKLQIMIPFKIEDNPPLKQLRIETNPIKQKIQRLLLLKNIKISPNILEDVECLSKLNFVLDLASIHNIESLGLLKKIISQTYNLSNSLKQVIDILNNSIQEVQDTRVYSLGDVYGPVVINDETDKNKVIECLSFYEMCKLPSMTISCKYIKSEKQLEKKNLTILEDIKQYIKFFKYQINDDQQENKEGYKFNSVIWITQKAKQQNSYKIILDQFYVYNIVRFIEKVGRQGQLISSTFNNQVLCKYCITSILKLIQLQKGSQNKEFSSVLQFIDEFVGGKNNIKFIESILIMILEDAHNIMKVVKGILIMYDYKQKYQLSSTKQLYKISQFFSCYGISYQIDDQIFKITIKICSTTKQLKQIQPFDTNIISRKEFLNTVFSSTQFLTGYFINKTTLANELVKISKQIGQTVNSVVNFSINYNELYNFIQNIKENVAIKEIDGLLTGLNNQINGNYKKYVQSYLSSKQLGIQHQVTLIAYFESLYKKLVKNNGGSYNTKEQYKFGTHADNSNGISQIYNFSTELKSSNSKEINIKNMYLIQIYKNYFVSIVREGMSVILGYKTNRPPKVLQLKKKEDINNVNVTEISFLLIISNRLPTKDEINYEKIIKIFVSDLNENIYEINKELSLKLLELPEESDERILAHAVPVLQPNVILVFKSDYSKKQITNQQDDNNHKYFEISLNLAGKNKIISKNKIQVSCMDLLKIDPQFNNSMKSLTDNIKSILRSNINITLKIPGKSLQSSRISQVFMFGFIDFEQALANIFAESTRNKDLELFTSIMRGEEISENILGKEKRKIFQDFYDSITFEIQEEVDGKIKIQGKNIKILYTYKISNDKNINVTTICDVLLKDMIQKLLKKYQKIKGVYDIQLNQNKQKQGNDYLAIFQYLLISKYQTQVIESSIDIAKKIGKAKKNIKGYSVRLRSEQKTFMKYDKQSIIFNIRLRTPFREFITADKILQFIFNGFAEIMEGLTSTKYNPQNQSIQIFNYDSVSPLEMIVVGKQKIECTQIKINNEGNLKKSTYQFNNSNNYMNYYLVQKEGQICYVASNYFWSIDKNIPYLQEKKNSGVSKNKFSLLLVSPFPINMNQCTINLCVHVTKNERANETVNVIKKIPEVQTQIKLLSKEMLKLELTPLVSSTISVQLGKFRLFCNDGFESVSITSTSGKQMVQENTKFVELIFRNKVFKPHLSDLQKREQNLPFIEPAEKINLSQKVGNKQKNVEDMVYIVNENSKKFLTRAGEVRVDVINVCDDEGNPINFNPNTKIFFRHLNIPSQIIQPAIKYQNDNVRVELSWSPKVRGPYEIFLNSTRLNPNYEIGVMAAVADIKNLKIQYPKKTEICFAEQTQCSILLKDSFGNIYTELEEAFISDSLIINIVSNDVDQSIIKLKAQKIDKYGLKKIRFSFDDPTGSDEKNVKAFLQINMENVAEFNLKIKGQSLAQRRKRLQKDMQGATKRYYTDVTVSRNNFIQSLFKIADKSLDKNFSIKFAGQQGIDAGGLKRQFYDMIGKQLKNPQNPFFIQTDASRHNEYFINQQILKNKKKLEYMYLFGQYLANSLINGYLIGINFSNTFVKMLYQDPITFDDMLSVLSKQQASRYEYLIKADADYIDDLQIYFSCVLNRKKGIEVEMIENGKNIKVTKDNINQYLKLLPEFLITERYKEIMDSFRKGFQSVVKIQIIRRWIRSDEFWCLTAGVKEITPEVVLSYVVIRGGKETHHAWFRAYITEASQQILEGFLKFSSGSSSIDFYQNSKISVVFENQGENTKKLPISHTCWKQIDIPAYKTYAVMKQLLNAAFLYCSQGFGFG